MYTNGELILRIYSVDLSFCNSTFSQQNFVYAKENEKQTKITKYNSKIRNFNRKTPRIHYPMRRKRKTRPYGYSL